MSDRYTGNRAIIPPVIQYHKIDKPTPGTLVRGGFTPPRRFARQMAFLKKHGFVFYTASGLIEYFTSHGSFPKKGIAVTFDDGWRDNYINAFPVLRALGLVATVYIVPSCLGERSTKAVAEGESLREHLTREQVLEMSGAGIEFGSHSLNHRLLHQLPHDEIVLEVEVAKREIENLTQKECKTFAYPAGHYNPLAQRVIANAGHIAAFSTTYGPLDSVDLYALNRIEIL
ncbi:MAG: polysaccharide deacetylase family protein, partial [Pyrinomonadaceae bacterium]